MLASACASGAVREAGAADPEPPPAAAPLPRLPGATAADRLQQYNDGALAVDASDRSALRNRLGPPDSSAAEPTPNRHVPGQVDSVVAVYYRDLAVELYRTASGVELLQGVDVTANRWLRFAPGIGATVDDLRSELGEPVETTDSTLVFLCTDCGPVEEPMTFFLRDGRVWRVRFAYYVD